jgi:hypothetical protein
MAEDALKLPTFLIIGANRAGTTSLFAYLAQHPDVFMPVVKEPMFFTGAGKPQLQGDLNKASLSRPVATTTLEEYASLFEESQSGQLRGEASTSYLANPRCAAAIHDIIPDVRLVAILRNPIDRAFSNYLMYWGRGIETRTFDQCVLDEIEGRDHGIPQGRWYLRLGLYADAIRRFQAVFGRDALLIASYDEFCENPRAVYARVLEHIGANPSFAPDMTVHYNRAEDHVGVGVRVDLSAAVRAKLRDYFHDDIQQLASLVEFDTTIWLVRNASTSAQ